MIRDEQLVVRARAGEREAFEELLRRHLPRVWRIARSFAPTPDDAHDLCQEALVAAFAHLPELREPARFGEWLEAIARNCGREWRRRSAQLPLLSLEDNGEVPAPQESEERRLLRRQVAQALAALPPDQEQLLRLHYLHGYSYRETAALFDLPAAAVRGRLHRARQALRKEWRQMTFDSLPGWEIVGEDLAAVRRSAEFAWPGPERDVINALCFRDGALATTDSYRLYYYRSAAFNPIGSLLVHADLARALSDRPAAQRARLAAEGGEAVLRLDTGEELRAPLVAEAFPALQSLLEHDYRAASFTARADDWLTALRILSAQRGDQTNTDHGPRAVLALSPDHDCVTLRQSFPAAEGRRVPWDSAAYLPARFDPGSQSLLVAANAEFLSAAVRGLGVSPGEQVEFGASNPLGPFRLRRPGDESSFVLTMPMQLTEA